MIKLSALIGTLTFLYYSWSPGLSLPRVTQGSFDYVLMPLLGYIAIIIVAQLAARLNRRQTA